MHIKDLKVLSDYTNKVTPKSIDEFIIDFRGSLAIQRGRNLTDVGLEIKQKIKESLGEYVTVNVGIGTNRFLAKTAAGLHKPDGLDVITGEHLKNTYRQLSLIDLTGINVHYEARLNVAGIYTPLQFLDADASFLKQRVFHSKLGLDWYLRLRGWEVDDVIWDRKSFGHQYALGQKTADRQQLSQLLMKLCEKTGRRLRDSNHSASGIQLFLRFTNRQYWAKGKETKAEMYATPDIFLYAQRLLNQAIIPAKVTNIGVAVYGLRSCYPKQLGFFDNTRMDKRSLANAVDKLNNKYGEFTVIPAVMANMDNTILDRIAFGSVRN